MKTELMCRMSVGGKPLWRRKGVGRSGRGEAAGPGRGRRRARKASDEGSAERGPSRAHSGFLCGLGRALRSVTAKEQRGSTEVVGAEVGTLGGALPAGRWEPLSATAAADSALSFSRSVVSDSETPGTVARQAPLTTGFSRQEHWGGLPFPSPGDLPGPRMGPASPALAGSFFAAEPPGKPQRGGEPCGRDHPGGWQTAEVQAAPTYGLKPAVTSDSSPGPPP